MDLPFRIEAPARLALAGTMLGESAGPIRAAQGQIDYGAGQVLEETREKEEGVQAHQNPEH